MIDGIIKADGTSRLMRATLPATYEEFKAQAAAGTLPFDVLFNAEGWSQLPTFLNKANLLKDSTANVFGLSSNAVPDDVFGVLSRFQNSLGNEYVWAKYGVTYNPFWGAAENCYFVGTSGITTSTKPTLVLYNSVSYVDGLWVLSDVYKTYTLSTGNIADTLSTNALKIGVKYFKDSSGNVWKTTPGSSRGSYSGSDNVWVPYVTSACKLTGTQETANGISYVNSPDPNAYPVDDGYTYSFLGPIGGAARIATGSYTGTGKYGASNPNSLTFDFEPKLLFVRGGSSTTHVTALFVRPDASTSEQTHMGFYSNSVKGWPVKFSNKTVSWYDTQNALTQGNDSSTTYYYVAIG